uniref:Putative secreted protein n=1 Tax=Anopheles triannulatus TaxID=58253 RepID=A0A2M4B534_9DIPT
MVITRLLLLLLWHLLLTKYRFGENEIILFKVALVVAATISDQWHGRDRRYTTTATLAHHVLSVIQRSIFYGWIAIVIRRCGRHPDPVLYFKH